MVSFRVLSRAAVLLLLVAACSSGGSASKAPTAPPTAGTAGPATAVPPTAVPTIAATPNGTAPAGVDSAPADPAVDPWARNAVEFRGQNGKRFALPCPANGTESVVWGTDVYTDDSSICTAGVHVGVITPQSGGYVIVEIRPAQDSYTGSDRNGVSTVDYASWAGSYVVIKL